MKWKRASSAERSRASVLRAKLAEGRPITPDETSWLASYDAGRKTTGMRSRMLDARLRAEQAARSSDPSPATSSAATSSPTTPASSPLPPPPPPPEPEPELELELEDDDDDDDQDDDDTGELEPAKCDIPKCSACRTQRGGLVCKATGRIHYDPISPESAELLAGMCLGGVGVGVRFLRADKRARRPTPHEKQRLTEGMQKLIHNRMPQVGAVDDLLLVGGLLIGYGTAALNEPTEAPPGAPRLPSSSSARPLQSVPAPKQEPKPEPTRSPAKPAADEDDFDEATIREELRRATA